jgi:hypothetical protein
MMPEAAREAYVAGVVDSWADLEAMSRAAAEAHPSTHRTSAGEDIIRRVLGCLSSARTTRQEAYLIVARYMAGQTRHHGPMVGLVWSALDQAVCKR